MVAVMVRKHKVLKLVHPGGFVEIHKNPITAYEVMKKNPRHCVTRPDVFKFPWIVIRPESILSIGSVFYIVPFHTIHCLLRRRKCPFENNIRLLEEQLAGSSPVKSTYFHELVNEQCPKAFSARSKIDFKVDDLPEDAMFPKCLIQDNPCLNACQCEDRESLFKSQFELELEKFDDHWSTNFTREGHQEASLQAARDSLDLRRTLFSSVSASDDVVKDQNHRRDALRVRYDCSQNENKVLKSCLKKESNGKSRAFKVKFIIPSENEETNSGNTLKLREKFP